MSVFFIAMTANSILYIDLVFKVNLNLVLLNALLLRCNICFKDDASSRRMSEMLPSKAITPTPSHCVP